MGPDYPRYDVIDLHDWPAEYDPDEILAAIKSRRSIRRFKDEKIPREEIVGVLEAGRFTPTGSNAQNVRYILVQDSLDDVKAQVWQGFDAIIQGYVARQGAGGRLYQTLTRMQSQHAADPANDQLFCGAPALLIVCSPSALNGGLAASSIALMAHASGSAPSTAASSRWPSRKILASATPSASSPKRSAPACSSDDQTSPTNAPHHASLPASTGAERK